MLMTRTSSVLITRALTTAGWDPAFELIGADNRRSLGRHAKHTSGLRLVCHPFAWFDNDCSGSRELDSPRYYHHDAELAELQGLYAGRDGHAFRRCFLLENAGRGAHGSRPDR